MRGFLCSLGFSEQFRLVQRPILAPVLSLTDRRAVILGIPYFLRSLYAKYNFKIPNNLCIIVTQKYIARHGMASGSPAHRTEWAHITRTQ